MEKVEIKSINGKAKVVGTLVCVVGALILSLYKGMVLINSRHSVVDEHHFRAKRFGVGAAFLAAGSLAWSSWFLMQSRIGRYFPHRYSSTLIMSLFSSFQSAILCLAVDRKLSKWIVEGEVEILTVIFSVSVSFIW